MNKQEKYSLDEGALISDQKQLNGMIQIIIGKMGIHFKKPPISCYIQYFDGLWYFFFFKICS